MDRMTIDESLDLIGSLLMAYNVGSRANELRYLNELCERLCGERPTPEQIREYIDSDFGVGE